MNWWEYDGPPPMTPAQIHTLCTDPRKQLAFDNIMQALDMKYRIVRCRIKNPVPHPLSLAVKAAITWSHT